LSLELRIVAVGRLQNHNQQFGYQIVCTGCVWMV